MSCYICRSGGKYRGAYSLDENTKKVTGNPADSPEVQDTMKSIVNMFRAGGERDHAEAITIEDVQKIVRWSEQQVSSKVDWAVFEFSDTSHLLFVAKHLQTRAFMSMGFTIWTRCAFSLHFNNKNAHHGAEMLS